MNRFRLQRTLWTVIACLLFAEVVPSAVAQSAASSANASSTTEKAKQKSGTDKAASEYKSEAAASTGSGNASSPPAAAPKKAAKPAVEGAPTDAEIAAAKASGKVWVNLDSGIYHRSGRWYGKTKNGKFMTEAEAKAAGYRASQKN